MEMECGCLVEDENAVPERGTDTCPEVCPHHDYLAYCVKPWGHDSGGHVCDKGHYW